MQTRTQHESMAQAHRDAMIREQLLRDPEAARHAIECMSGAAGAAAQQGRRRASAPTGGPAVPDHSWIMDMDPAAGVTLVSGKVSEVIDASGFCTITQTNNTYRPDHDAANAGLNGYPTIDFFTADELSVSGLTTSSGTSFTAFVVLDIRVALASNAYLLDAQTGRLILSLKQTTGPGWYDGGSQRDVGASAGTGAMVLTYRIDGTNGQVWKDGTSLGTAILGTARALGGSVRIGGVYTSVGSGKIQADMARFLIAPSALSTVDREAVEADLSTGYGTP